ATTEERDGAFIERDQARQNETFARLELRRLEKKFEKKCDTERMHRILTAAGFGAALGAVGGIAIGVYAGWLESALGLGIGGASGFGIGGLAGAGVGAVWDGICDTQEEQKNREYFEALGKSAQFQ